MVKTGTIHLSAQGFCDLINITERVQEQIDSSMLQNGIVTVFVPGATGALITLEYEGGLMRDFCEFMEKTLPKNAKYYHNERWGDGNGFSHMRAALMGPSLTIPFVNGKLTLGTWQQIVFVDFDNRPRTRNLICQTIGE
jgi:secondary thiamine-phosphate synthase enzyme